MKYECLECGRSFDGDNTTVVCPYCGSEDINHAKTKMPRIIVTALICLCILGLPFLFNFLYGIYWPKNNPIFATLRVDDKSGAVYIDIDGVETSKLRSDFDILVNDTNRNNVTVLHFDGQSSSTSQLISLFEEGETYQFNFVHKDGKPVGNFQWLGDNVYTRPLPPSPPVIEYVKSSDCTTGKFTITIVVKEGSPNRFYLDGMCQGSPVFVDVLPQNDKYILKAEDTVTQMFSEDIELYCRPSEIQEFRVSEQQIQAAFDAISTRSIGVGDAMSRISQGCKNINLSKQIDGCTTIEDALNYARSLRIRYKVCATIESKDCSDIITSITLSK